MVLQGARTSSRSHGTYAWRLLSRLPEVLLSCTATRPKLSTAISRPPISFSTRSACKTVLSICAIQTNFCLKIRNSLFYLLLQEYNAKLSDFGLAKDGPSGDKSHVSTRVMGTQGYAAPEYLATGNLCKHDLAASNVSYLFHWYFWCIIMAVLRKWVDGTFFSFIES